MTNRQDSSSNAATDDRGWYHRGYVPHFDAGRVTQSVTFRLADSLPDSYLDRWRKDLGTLPKADRDVEVYRRVERYLDLGWGVCHLREPAIASLVVRALHQFDGQRYVLHAWVVMPNHVHAQITPLAGVSLAGLLHSWKSYTAKAANRALELRGRFWSREYYDRYIRSETHFRDVTRYIEENPVKAGLCTSPSRWPFSSAAGRA